jgi:hypothetical protein
VLHAGVTEWLQTFVPGRSGTVSDVCINCVGIGLGLLAARLVWPGESLVRGAGKTQPPDTASVVGIGK